MFHRVFLQGGCSFWRPTNSAKALKANNCSYNKLVTRDSLSDECGFFLPALSLFREVHRFRVSGFLSHFIYFHHSTTFDPVRIIFTRLRCSHICAEKGRSTPTDQPIIFTFNMSKPYKFLIINRNSCEFCKLLFLSRTFNPRLSI